MIRQLFFFPSPLSNINVLSPQTHLKRQVHVPHTDQMTEIRKLQSQAANQGFKMRTGHGISCFNLLLLQLHDPPLRCLGDAYVLKWMGRGKVDAHGKSSWWAAGCKELGGFPHSCLRSHVDTFYSWKTHAHPVRALWVLRGLTGHNQPHLGPLSTGAPF